LIAGRISLPLEPIRVIQREPRSREEQQYRET
jgi:hypothetical protein